MDVTCSACSTVYNVSPAYADYSYRCYLCHHPLKTREAGFSVENADQAPSMYVVCAFCQHNFGVPLAHQGGAVRCPSCNKDVNLAAASQTMAMDSTCMEALDPLMVTAMEDQENDFLPTPNQQEPEAGCAISGYRLGRVIGHTALGSIYEGEQSALRRPVAMYVLNEELSQRTECCEIFLREARKSAALIHPHIARVYDVLSSDDRHVVVSELVQGQSLEERVRERKFLGTEELARLGIQICQALQNAHDSGFVHGSLSPANIMIDGKGEIRILHFGIGRALTGGQLPRQHAGWKNLLLMLAPEQLLQGAVDGRADLFALGVTLYIALTGTIPYHSVEMEQVIQHRGIPRPPDIRHICPDLPQPLVELLRYLLQIQPEERLQSAAEVQKQLEDFLRGEWRNQPKPIAGQENIQKRRYRRFRTDMDVQIRQAELKGEEKKEYISRIGNLSENGAFISTQQPLPVKSFVELEFALESSGTRVHVMGIVRWVDTTPGQVGMGVQFLQVSTANRHHINRYVDERSATDILKGLTATHLHKVTLKALVTHWGRVIPMSRIMQGTGAGKHLFQRVIKDFEEAGLARVIGDKVECLQPDSEALCEAVLYCLRAIR